MPEVRKYLLALALVGAAIACRVALRPIAPGVGPYVLTFPAIVAAGVFFGTLPTIGAALSAAIATCALIFETSIFSPETFNTAQLDTALFLPSCAAIIWATHRLRRSAASAVLAEARLREVFRQLPGAAAILEAPSGRLLLNSKRSSEILGHPELDTMAEYGGLHADGRRFAPDDYPIIRALRAGEVVGGEHIFYRRPDGSIIDLDVHAGPVRDPNGHIVAAVGMAFDVTQRREREDALREALQARDVLMREADHRIKNSLQLVASLLSIQLSKANDVASKQTLGEAIARVEAIANAHLALARSPDLRMIEIENMMSELCKRVAVLNPAVEISFSGDSGASLEAEQAIPLGLIASELLTNALRHAFPLGETGQVVLTVVADDNAISLVVADRGRGLPDGPPNAPRRQGLGSSVITALAKQIGASVSTESSAGRGTAVTVRLERLQRNWNEKAALTTL
jgi:PAS domain S-box-containing protein